MYHRVLGVLLAFLAVPIYGQDSTAPSVTLNSTGTVVGVTDPTTGLDTFLGIPYARPPVGSRRFAAPVALSDDPSRTIQATEYGPVCPQPPSVSATFPDPAPWMHLTRVLGIFSAREHV